MMTLKVWNSCLVHVFESFCAQEHTLQNHRIKSERTKKTYHFTSFQSIFIV